MQTNFAITNHIIINTIVIIIGVSANIIDASFQALVDSITYKLVRAGVGGE